MATIQYVVNAIDSASATFTRIAGSADELNAKLDDLNHKSATARVGLDGDDKAKLSLDEIDLKMARLADKLARPKITLEGQRKALLDIAALNLALDKLNAKTAKPDVNVAGRGILSWIFGGGGGGGGGSAGKAASSGGFLSGLGGFFSSAGSVATPVLIGSASALAASLLPALVPLALGVLAGGAGAGGSYAAANFLQTQIFSQQSLLNSIQRLQAGKLTPANRATLALDQAKYAAGTPVGQLQALYNPLAGFQNTIQDIGGSALMAFARALTSPGSGGGRLVRQGRLTGFEDVMTPSFLQGVTGILGQAGGLIRGLGPQLGDLFRSSLPFVKMFVTVLGQAAQAILPAMTQSLKQMTPYLPQLTKGFLLITQGIADFIKDLGPGMKPAAQIFVATATVIKGLLIGLAYVADAAAIALVKSFGEVRRVWNSTIIAAKMLWDSTTHYFDAMRHDIVADLDKTRDQSVQAWDFLWRNTVGRVQKGTADVVSWFRGLPGRIIGALGDLSGLLERAGEAVLTGFLSGLENAWHKVTSFVSGIGGWIASHKGPLSADRMLLVPHGTAIMDGLLAGLSSRMPALQQQMTRTTGAITGAPHGTQAAGGMIVNITVNAPVGSSPREIGRQVADMLKAYIKGGGQLYPAGVVPR